MTCCQDSPWHLSESRGRRCRVHDVAGIHRPSAQEGGAETTNDPGRFDDESRCYSVIITVARDSARMTVIRRERGPSSSPWQKGLIVNRESRVLLACRRTIPRRIWPIMALRGPEAPHTMTRPTSGGQGYHVVRS